MDKTAVFTISKTSSTGVRSNRYNITSKKYNLYNKLDVSANQLFDAMEELTDIFSNVIGISILFEID